MSLKCHSKATSRTKKYSQLAGSNEVNVICELDHI